MIEQETGQPQWRPDQDPVYLEAKQKILENEESKGTDHFLDQSLSKEAKALLVHALQDREDHGLLPDIIKETAFGDRDQNAREVREYIAQQTDEQSPPVDVIKRNTYRDLLSGAQVVAVAREIAYSAINEGLHYRDGTGVEGKAEYLRALAEIDAHKNNTIAAFKVAGELKSAGVADVVSPEDFSYTVKRKLLGGAQERYTTVIDTLYEKRLSESEGLSDSEKHLRQMEAQADVANLECTPELRQRIAQLVPDAIAKGQISIEQIKDDLRLGEFFNDKGVAEYLQQLFLKSRAEQTYRWMRMVAVESVKKETTEANRDNNPQLEDLAQIRILEARAAGEEAISQAILEYWHMNPDEQYWGNTPFTDTQLTAIEKQAFEARRIRQLSSAVFPTIETPSGTSTQSESIPQ